jgi:metallo-beta-lactamase class B
MAKSRAMKSYLAKIAFAALFLLSNIAISVAQHQPNFDWNQPFKPLRIVGNIHYVGTNDLACYLITSPEGHILLDAGEEKSVPLVKASIAALGFKLSDIKIIITSHAHFDHVGGVADMKAATGAQVFASAADAIVLESGGTKSFFPLGPYKEIKVDRVLKEGDIVELGGNRLKVHLTPGHTEGNTAWTMEVTENGKKLDVVFVSSMSINPGVQMVNFKPWPGIADAYAESFKTLRDLHCDVFLGPHASFFDLEKKARLMDQNPETHPFIDPAGYKRFLDNLEKAYLEQIKREQVKAKTP